jgi:flagellar hook-associated protein 1 FlgK
VIGDRARPLQVSGPGAYPGTAGAVSVTWAADGSAATLGGTAGGMTTALNETLPSYLGSLDSIASSLQQAVNDQQAAGFDGAGNQGAPLFAGTGAANLRVALSDPAAVAASTAAPPTLDGDNAILMAQHAVDATGPDATYRSLIVQLGVQAQSINRRSDLQAAVAAQVEGARTSVSGVSLDEEMTSLVAYQHSYEAAAKFVSTIDATLDTLINMTR